MEKQQTKVAQKLKDDQKERSNEKLKAAQRSPPRENTKPVEIKLHTQRRAAKRALFNHFVATKWYLLEQQKKNEEKMQKLIEEEEIRLMRKEMVPKAQLMPFFDRPFFPQRSDRPLTIPREPNLHMLNNRSWSRMSCNEAYGFSHHRHAMKAI